MPDENFQQHLEILKQNYAFKLKDKVNNLSSIEEKLKKKNYDFETLKELYITTHRLSGASGMFGFADIGEEAHKLEVVLYPMVKEAGKVKIVLNTEVLSLVCNLRKKIEKEL